MKTRRNLNFCLGTGALLLAVTTAVLWWLRGGDSTKPMLPMDVMLGAAAMGTALFALAALLTFRGSRSGRRPLTEIALRESEDQLRVAKAAAGLGIHDFNIATGEIRWDERVREIWGAEPGEEITYDRFMSGIDPADRESTEAAVQRSLDPTGDGVYLAHYRVISSRDGAQRWVEATGRCFFNERREPQRLVGTVQDISERFQVAEALRTSEERFRFAAEAVNGIIYDADLRAGRVVRSRGLFEVLGYRPEDVPETVDWWGQQIHPVDFAEQSGVLAATVARGETHMCGHYRVRHRDGRWLHVEDRSILVRDAAGDVIRMVGCTIDITARVEAERALRASEERFRQLADTVPQIVWVVRPDGVYEYCNRRWTQYSGRPPGEDFAAEWEDLLHPEDRAKSRARWESSARTGEPYEIECRLRGGDGSYRWFLGKALPVRNDAGEIAKWFGTCTDIHDQKASERVLRASEARLRFLNTLADRTGGALAAEEVMATTTRLLGQHLDVSLCAYADVDDDGEHFHIRHDWTAPGVTSLTGEYAVDAFGPAGATLRRGAPFVARDVQAELGDAATVFQALGVAATICLPLVKGGRLTALMAVHSARPRDWSEEEVAFVQEVAERSWAHIERVRAAAALVQADRRKDEFLATLAHELRNPLAPLRSGLEVIKLCGGGEPAAEEARSMMERQLEQMVRLVDDLMDISRISRGKVELRRAPVLLAGAIQAGIETSRPLIESLGHRLTVEWPEVPLRVNGDEVRLAQIFANLLNNAAKYSAQPGEIRVQVGRDDDGNACVSVRDEGVGIPRESLTQVFDLFTQVDRSLERAQGGLGIGLSLVKGLVLLHGGTIEAHSEGPGRGSEFRVRIPALTETPAPGAANAADVIPAPPRPGRRVLVADDNADAAAALAMLLKMTGHEVRVAADGIEAVDCAKTFHPEVALLDIGMPRLNGYDACRQIRAEHGNRIVLVAITGWGQDEDKMRARDAGFDHHIVKPIAPEALESLLGGAGFGSRPDRGGSGV